MFRLVFHHVLLLVVVLSLGSIHTAAAEEFCTVCPDKAPIPSEFRSKNFTIPGFEAIIKTCGDLEVLAPTQLRGSELCTVLHSLSSYCGCNILLGENACHICPNQTSVTAEYLNVETAFSMGRVTDPRIPAKCGLVEAALHTVTKYTEDCAEGGRFAGTCGCPGVEVGEPAPAAAPTPTPQPCSLCRFGGQFAYPHKDVSLALEQAGLLQGLLDLGLAPVCAVVAGIVSTLPENSDDCRESQTFLGGLCGCAPVQGYCDFCPNDDDVPNPGELMYPVEAKEGFLPTCSDMNLTLTQFRESSVSLFFQTTTTKMTNSCCPCVFLLW
jgi:hypothetical protein